MNICLKVRVIPNSHESKIEEGIIKVKSPPENNRANIEILKLVSKKYKVAPSKIKIVGKSSKNKTIVIKQ